MESVVLRSHPSSVRQARRFVREVLRRWQLGGSLELAELLTSELATNSVLHARTDFSVTVEVVDSDIKVSVLDHSIAPPRQRTGGSSTLATTGRGLEMVSLVASAWGRTPPESLDGYAKGVWFTLPAAGIRVRA
jgi:anti-sigma regulatory factor (Ser/Thr protein kinase)